MINRAFDALRIAKVTKIHPEANSVDLVFLDDGSKVPMVQILGEFASSNTGLADMAEPASTGQAYDPMETRDRDIYAGCVFAKRVPYVIGFLFPQVCQMLFEDMNLRIDRHASDVYSTIDGNGNTEHYHPSGTFIRIATDPAHRDLTGQDFDKKWAISKNTDKAVHVHVTVANAGTVVATIDIDPSGNVTEQNNGNLSADIGQNATIHVGGNATATIGGNLSADVTGNATATIGGTCHVTSTGAMTLAAPTITLDTPVCTITGVVAVQHTGGAGAAATIAGQVNVTGGGVAATGDVTGQGTSLHTHTHSGVQPGLSNTGPPV